MRLARYEADGRVFLGEVRDGMVIDLLEAAGHEDNLFGRYLEFGRKEDGVERVLDGVRLLAPINKPSKIVCVGLNYRDHCLETGSPIPDHPVLFSKFPNTIIGTGEPITFDRSVTSKVDYEVELAVVIGQTCGRVSENDALDLVFGYAVANDVSARDLQFVDTQWMLGKSLDTFCPLGPQIVSGDEIHDPQGLQLRCWVNGALYQDSNTDQMIFGVAALVAYISRGITLEPGDVILTGTPAGVGFTRKPPVYLKDGDTVKVEIDRICAAENPVREVGLR